MNIIYNIAEIDSISKKILDQLPCKVVCLFGPLGAGKTTLVQAILKCLGGLTPATSPTFSVIEEHPLPCSPSPAYHLDCYRIEDPEEGYDLGLEEILTGDHWVFIEWAEHILPLLPKSRAVIHLSVISPDTRQIHLEILPSPA
ncbi:tRNA (adenosine(37)-N6)-threonylcarbamoyltransferase complex ATPase subunit type 1 TsaE [Robiginitalea sp. M366]|uniref:tRNA (adenosine(37)-N6)-threonylcarbamoyltransferase complex ATPase subunit type 1 TsaE n=1 Tax=Robiginitalea aestuariiviva TaxID=3036903 RepID=UPI00240E95CB|nr:tRNA (adenosine(37)-N6)-threonylcarbamoyltransferase complex ATPase subunit type 1 TsaE [Robiginitalea aestuariiviva]MDG1572981.1 tRNA (adenosine(37)-N6)-threonylcarbamoyltransferase complex ATPase subunit type 1 TsaE [Robiginitalea aestuariiviva]